VRKSRLMLELLPQLEILLSEKEKLQPKNLFTHNPKEIWLEIGFGGGEHLATQAVQNPEVGFIGCEPFVNGVAGLLDHIDAQQIKNVRVLADDARQLLDALPDASIDRCYVLFADPWPKARHVERRFIGPINIPRLSRIIKPGSELRLATDDPTLAVWTKEVMDAAEDFTCLYHTTTPPTDWVPTRYEEKGVKAGRVPVYMSYQRK
jgi:tRNA (guanine-N7-)-methyltransferase